MWWGNWIALLVLALCSACGTGGGSEPNNENSTPAPNGESSTEDPTGDAAVGVGQAEPPPGPVIDDPDPANCEVIALGGLGMDHGSARIGPKTIAEMTVCLHLDGSDNERPHFAASTDNETGTTSSFELTLTEPDGTVVAEGWDVTFGGPTTSFANIERGFPGGEVHDLILRIKARNNPARTTVQISFFEPYE